jgi:hypothetical protein
MAILRSYKCETDGFFEAWEPVCPVCQSTEVDVVFLRPFAIRSGRTERIDRDAKRIAADFGMTNIKSAREGENQAGYFTRNNTPPEPQEQRGQGVMWGGAGGMNMNGALAGQYAKPVKDEQVSITPRSAGINRGPTTASYFKDHEGLKLDADTNKS